MKCAGTILRSMVIVLVFVGGLPAQTPIGNDPVPKLADGPPQAEPVTTYAWNVSLDLPYSGATNGPAPDAAFSIENSGTGTALRGIAANGTAGQFDGDLVVNGGTYLYGLIAGGNDGTIGPSNGYDTIFDFSHTLANFSTADNWSAFRSYITLDPSVDLAFPSAIYGHDLETTIAAGNAQDFYYVQGPYLGAFHRGAGDIDTLNGTTLGAQHFGSGTINYLVGGYAYSGAVGTGTITNNYGLALDCGHEGVAGGITNNYGLFINSPLHGRPLENHYGIYLNDQDFGDIDSYAIYSDGGVSYFKDRVGIGTEIPQAMLHIGGVAGVDGIRFPDGTLQTTAAIGGNNDSVWSVLNGNALRLNGNVGIGTSNPQKRLQIGDANILNSEAMVRLASRSGVNPNQRTWDVGVPETDADLSGIGFSFVIDDTQRGTDPEFIVHWGNGNVGVGTINPWARFHAVTTEQHTAIAGDTTSDYAGVSGANWTTGTAGYGVLGHAITARGVVGESDSNTAVEGNSNTGWGMFGRSNTNIGVFGQTLASAAAGVLGRNEGTAPGGQAVFGYAPGAATGVLGISNTGEGVHGDSTTADGVVGVSHAAGKAGVFGYNNSQFGGAGVSAIGEGLGGNGVFASANGLNGVGVFTQANNGNNAKAIWAVSTTGRAGMFDGAVEVNGGLTVRTLTITGGADLAEPFDVINHKATEPESHDGTNSAADESTTIEPGSVVVIDPANPGKLMVSTGAYDKKVAGVVSGANNLDAGMLLKSTGQALADGATPVALTGRAWCKCDASTGPIEPGDMLTTSHTPGHAMKASDESRAHGAVIGKAMTALPAGESGLVLVLVNLQ